MSEDEAKLIWKVLRKMGILVAEYPCFLYELDQWLKSYPSSADTIRRAAADKTLKPDIFGVYSAGGMKELENLLGHQDVNGLRRLIMQFNLDPSKLSYKWKDRERLVNLIKDRVSSKANKGNVFMHYISESHRENRDHNDRETD
ncbi:MAG: hypothetical protein M1422_07390 [Candidatus Thermoplasmatota archaeon]|nr:hypothetical protein [Candidatus Thermoplasmatota archaeon]MCL5252946.1 hypothetical protein [Candidatus Thermoplasmatota archaeon]